MKSFSFYFKTARHAKWDKLKLPQEDRRNVIRTGEVLDEDLAGGVALQLALLTSDENQVWQKMKDDRYEVLDPKISLKDIVPDNGEGQPFNNTLANIHSDPCQP